MDRNRFVIEYVLPGRNAVEASEGYDGKRKDKMELYIKPIALSLPKKSVLTVFSGGYVGGGAWFTSEGILCT